MREKLLAHRKLATAISTVVIVLGLAFIVKRLTSSHIQLPKFPDRCYYTIDDGATLFSDEITKIPPFDHDGKPAVRAYVYTCDGGRHQWVQYLEKYSDDALKKAESPVAPGTPDASTPSTAGLVIKKPGGGEWAPETGIKARDLMDPKCPDGGGSGPPVMLNP